MYLTNSSVAVPGLIIIVPLLGKLVALAKSIALSPAATAPSRVEERLRPTPQNPVPAVQPPAEPEAE